MNIITAAFIAAIKSKSDLADDSKVKNAYLEIKELIRKRFGEESELYDSICRLKKNPNSKARADLIDEEIESIKADQLSDIQRIANKILDLIGHDKLPKYGIRSGTIDGLTQADHIENVNQTFDNSKPEYNADVNGDGSIAQGDRAASAGKNGTAVSGDLRGGIHNYKIDKYYAADPTGEPGGKEKQKKTNNRSFEEALRDYCEKAISIHEKIPLAGFRTRLRVPIKIENIYVPLRVMIDTRSIGRSCFADADDAEMQLLKHGRQDEISVPDAFSAASKMNRRGIVILGDPGSGKTTHLKRLLLWCLQGGLSKIGLPENIVPVFLPLRELKDLDKSLDAFIQYQLDQPHLGTPEGFGRRLLKRENLLFLLDGLDEVVDAGQRAKVSRWIDSAATIYKNCYFVVTCRFAGYNDEARLNEDFLEMHMRPMSSEQAEAFVRNWYRIVETSMVGLSKDPEQAKIIADEHAEDLNERLRQPEFRARRVFELTRNPLLLTNICLVHHARGNLPHTRADLYDECTDVLLELWRGSIGLQPKVTAKTGRRVLQPAALWLHKEEGRTRATANELGPVIDPVLKDVGWPFGSSLEFLKAVRDESGLLTGWDQDHYGFMHLGFQEYLAAREIRAKHFEGQPVLQDLASHFGESWWQEVSLLLLALEEPFLFKPFMREVIKQPTFAEHTEIVEMCLDDSIETSTAPFMELLQQSPGKNRNLWERQLVALRIVERLDEEAIEGILPNLKVHPFDQIQNWLKSRKAEEQQDVIISKPGGYELVKIPGGVFMMGTREEDIPKLIETFGGDKDWYEWQTPQHKVTVPEFYMGKYPVTNEEYGRFLAEHKIEEPKYWGDRKYNQPKQPVVGVSWDDAQKYAQWAGLQLPSEAQWEYACRAGTTTEFYTGDTEKDLDRAGWYGKNSGDQLHPVGEKEPNAWSLYDMHGNVWEWCEDDWHSDYEGASVNGGAWIDSPRGANRVLRGGSWNGGARHCRSADRGRIDPDDRYVDFGFRLLCLPGHP